MQRTKKKIEDENTELKKLDQLKSDFISTVSHELRTPLAIIKEGVALVLDETAGSINPQQKKMLEMARNNADRLARIISDLLDISKIEAGRAGLKKELVDLVGLIEAVIGNFSSKVKDKDLQIKKNFSQEKVEVYVDKDKIAQVLVNLVNNALKFTDKGYIEVSLSERPGGVECSVSDTGRGISREDLPEVFEKFQQFEKTPGPGQKGTGLGLAICKGIVELHKGKIWIESELGKGTKVAFSLPKYTAKGLFKEYISDGLKEAVRIGESLSIAVFEIDNFKSVEEKLGKDKTACLLHNLEKLVRDNLRRKPDVTIKESQAILVLLPSTKKEDALVVAGRIRQMFNDYLVHEKLGISIEITPKVATFPEDGNTEEGLMRKMMS